MGRTSLLLVMAFNATFMMMGYRLSSASSKAYEKYSGYADIEQAQFVVESCSNIAISYALLDTPTAAVKTRCSGLSMFGKTGSSFTVTQYPTYDAVSVQDGESLRVVGSYPLTSSASISDPNPQMTFTTYVKVTGNSFSQYVFYSVSENGVSWAAGDTCRGKLHTQDKLNCIGSNGPPKTGPDFKGFVTTKLGVTIASGKPNFELGYGKADITLPTELKDLDKWGRPANGGAYFNYKDPSSTKRINMYVEFINDGSVIVRAAKAGVDGWSQTTASADPVPGLKACTTYASISALTTSGVMLVQNAELHVKGVLNGRITLGCTDTVNASGTKSNLSKVFIDGSLIYKDPPPCSRVPTNVTDDMLGIVATNNVYVSEHINHDAMLATLTNVDLNASIFSQTGSFTAENYASRGDCGNLNLVGGLQQKVRGAVAQASTPFNGFHKDYDWDNNLQNGAPIGYPTTKFLIKNWVDNVTIPNSFWE